MSVHRVQCLAQITRCSIKKMFAGARTPEGVSIKAAAGLRTQLHVPPKAIFLKNPSLHIAPRLLGYLLGLSRTCNHSNEVFLVVLRFFVIQVRDSGRREFRRKAGNLPDSARQRPNWFGPEEGLDFGFAER